MSDPKTDRQWQQLGQHQDALISNLRLAAEDFPLRTRHAIDKVANRLQRQEKLSQPQPKLLSDIDCVTVLSPILQELKSSNPSSDQQAWPVILRGLHRGIERLVSTPRQSQNIVGVFVYPAMLLTMALTLAYFISVYVLPEWDNTFVEFGIELPTATLLVLGIGRVVREFWLLTILLGVVCSLPFLIEVFRASGLFTSGIQWIDRKLMSRRIALAQWAEHTSMLLHAGVEEQLATSIASQRNMPARFQNPWPWRYALLEETLKCESNELKAALLDQTATYYYQIHYSVVRWWASFLPTCLLIAIGASIFFMVISLFMPLISIISGLSGGGGGAGWWW